MTVQIDKKGNRIFVRSESPLKGMKTSIPGAYLTTSGVWTVPLTLETCKLLREKFGRRLKVGTELKRWVAGVVQGRKQMRKLAKATDAQLRILPTAAPKLAKAMEARPYQRVGARFIADNLSTGLFDDPGLGKTLMAMGGLLEAGVDGPYLIVAPKTAAESVWKPEIEHRLPKHHRAVVLPEGRIGRDRKLRLTRYGRHTWLIVHPEVVLAQAWWICPECNKKTPQGNRQETVLPCGHERGHGKKWSEITATYPKLFEIEWGAVVIDESHESLIVRKGTPTQRRRGLDMLRVRPDGIKLAMSGTPFDSKPHQLWGTLNWLDPQQYPAFYRWSEMFYDQGGYTGHEAGDLRPDREKLLWGSLDAIVLRRTKAEVAPDLPPKTYVGTPLDPSDEDSPQGIWLEMDGKQRKAYEDIERASVAELDSGRLEPFTAIAELTRLKQLACCYGDIEVKLALVPCKRAAYPCPNGPEHCHYGGRHEEMKDFYYPKLPSNKFQWTVEALEEWGYPKNPLTKVVIVSFFTGILNAFSAGIESHFKTKPNNPLCTAITGQVSGKKRAPIIQRFNTGDGPNVMLLNVKAGGTAITLDTADRMIFVSETRIPDQQKQAEDRIHRVSNPRPVIYYYLRSLGTVDEGTAYANQEADSATHRLLDGRRGVEYFRQIMDLSHHRWRP